MYLRGFATKVRRSHRIELLDLETGDWRARQSVNKVVRERDFYRIEVEQLDPNAIETDVLGRLETAWAPLIRRLAQEAVAHARNRAPLPSLSEDDRELLDGLVAMMHVRRRSGRRRADGGLSKLGDGLLHRIVDQGPEAFERSIALAAEQGHDFGPLTYEDLRTAVERGDLRLVGHNNLYVEAMLRGWTELRDVLRTRNVCFLVAGGGSGLLATSDTPVGLSLEGGDVPEVIPGAADPRTPDVVVTMPLTSEVAVRFASDLPAGVELLGRQEAALVNSCSIAPDADVVLARTRSFFWWDGHEIRNAQDLPGIVSTWRREARERAEVGAEQEAARLLGVLP
jgi:hypothetical protein